MTKIEYDDDEIPGGGTMSANAIRQMIKARPNDVLLYCIVNGSPTSPFFAAKNGTVQEAAESAISREYRDFSIGDWQVFTEDGEMIPMDAKAKSLKGTVFVSLRPGIAA